RHRRARHRLRLQRRSEPVLDLALARTRFLGGEVLQGKDLTLLAHAQAEAAALPDTEPRAGADAEAAACAAHVEVQQQPEQGVQPGRDGKAQREATGAHVEAVRRTVAEAMR